MEANATTSPFPTTSPSRSAATSRAFTLIELMISVALVLVLLLGINEIFRLTSNTINIGQALSSGLRDQRAAQTTLRDDLTNAASDGPAFIIANQAVSAFKNKADETGSPDRFDPTWLEDKDKDGAKDADETASPVLPGNRIYRTDSVTFFTRKEASRRGRNVPSVNGDPSSVGTTRSGESMVTYGHARLPDDSLAEWFNPGQPDNNSSGKKNSNNRYATQWILARQQMILTPFVSSGSTETAWYPATPTATGLNLSPLSMATGSRTSGGSFATPSMSGSAGGFLGNQANGSSLQRVFDTTSANFPRVFTSEVDLAATSISGFAGILSSYQRDVAAIGVGNSPYQQPTNSGMWYLPADPIPSQGNAYSKTAQLVPQTLVYRAEVNPFNGRTDISKLVSQTAPIFLPRCTQFIVEYAGDFTTQVDDITLPQFGLVISDQPDGSVDYVIDPNSGSKRIRWYGLPRSTNSGDVDISSTDGTAYVGPRVRGRHTTINYLGRTYVDSRFMPDVVPLSDILMGLPNAVSGTPPSFSSNRVAAPFEKVIMTNRTTGQSDPNSGSAALVYFAIQNNPANSSAVNPTLRNSLYEEQPSLNYADPATGLDLQHANYVCAWSGGGPKMIRITITLEDPTATTAAAAQTYEYVYTLPY